MRTWQLAAIRAIDRAAREAKRQALNSPDNGYDSATVYLHTILSKKVSGGEFSARHFASAWEAK